MNNNMLVGAEFYYIVRIENLPSILQKGILSHQAVMENGIKNETVYIDGIVQRRKKKIVGGQSLWNYANLYLRPDNAMMSAITYGEQDLAKKARNIIVLGIDKSVADIPGAFITDGNAASEDTQFFPIAEKDRVVDSIKRFLNREPWKKDDDSKRIVMAEILIPNSVNPAFIRHIYIPHSDMMGDVKALIPLSKKGIQVIPEPGLFFIPKVKSTIDNVVFVDGNMFFSNAQTMTLSVNTVGVMGKGLAAEGKYLFPEMFPVYRQLCKSGELSVGHPCIFSRNSSLSQELPENGEHTEIGTKVLLFPTKSDYSRPSQLSWIEDGLKVLVAKIKEWGITSLAMPSLGCGLGELAWADVGPVMTKYLSQLEIPVWVYLPRESAIIDKHLTREFLLGK